MNELWRQQKQLNIYVTVAFIRQRRGKKLLKIF